MKNKQVMANISKQVKTVVVSDLLRKRLLFLLMNIILALTAFAMSVVNIFTKEYELCLSTAIFCLLCALNVVALRHTKIPEYFVYFAFCVEALAILAFFIISGIPNGFSVLWVCLVPSFAFIVFGNKYGFYFSLIALLMLLFFFWVPWGRSFLKADVYTSEFMLRFPLLYCSIFAFSFVVESVRKETQKQLEQSKDKYAHLYRHDALTGLYNRYGIKEYLNQTATGFASSAAGKFPAALILIDIDDFKMINDRYGHNYGDEVLKKVADILLETMCDHCHCCRWGGEEFLIVMQCSHDPSKVAENIRIKIENHDFIFGNVKINITSSFGVCISKGSSHNSIDRFIAETDAALYASKSNGKNCVTTTFI